MAQRKRTRCACGHPLPVRRFTVEGQRVCRTCHKHATAPIGRCPQCKRNGMELTGYIDGVRVCVTCDDRHRRAHPNGNCAKCGAEAYLVRGLCSRHYKQWQIASRPVGKCVDCREEHPLNTEGRCKVCAGNRRWETQLQARLEELLGPRAARSDVAQQLCTHLTAHRAAHRILKWLDTMAKPIRTTLRRIGHGNVPSWTALQQLHEYAGGDQLLATCVRAGIVQPPRADTDRVEQLLKKLQRAPDAVVEAVLVVKQFWRFYVAPRVRLRHGRKLIDRTLESDRARLTIAYKFLCYVLRTRNHPIAAMTADDLTAWMAQAPRSHVPRLRALLTWLFAANVIAYRLEVPKGRITPGTALPPPRYQAIEHRARTDAALPLMVRVALLLITKCARHPYEISPLPLSNLTPQRGGVIWIQFEHGFAQPLEGPDAQLVKQLCAQSRRRGSSWLFPSKPRPETHLSSNGLCRLIHEAGIAENLNQLRNAGFRDLLKDFTPSEVCEILGLGPRVADHWRQRTNKLTRSQTTYVNELARAARRAKAQVTRRAKAPPVPTA